MDIAIFGSFGLPYPIYVALVQVPSSCRIAPTLPFLVLADGCALHAVVDRSLVYIESDEIHGL